MSDMTDPFATVEQTDAVPQDAVPAQEAAVAAAPSSSFLAEMTMEDEDYAAPVKSIRYIRPAEGTWVPVRITAASIEQRDMKAVVAYSKSGEVAVTPKAIDALVADEGAEQVVEQIPLYQFTLEAEHVATCFGERSSGYRMYTQVFPMRIPLNKPRTRGGVVEVGFDKNSGKKLLAATRVVTPGMSIKEDPEQLQAFADAMVADGGRIVMAKVRLRTKKSDDAIPRKNADGSFVKARTDEVEGSLIRLTKSGDGFFYKNSGDAFEGPTAGLIPYGDDFLIPDSSEDGAMVKDTVKREAIFDNLADDVYSVPGRQVSIHRNDGTEVEGEITWDTVGFVAVQPVKAGTLIQAQVGEELLTATWLGTHWQETDVPHELQVGEDGEVRMVSVAEVVTGDASKTLDMFKGDPA